MEDLLQLEVSKYFCVAEVLFFLLFYNYGPATNMHV